MDHLPSHAELSEQIGKKLKILEEENRKLKELLKEIRTWFVPDPHDTDVTDLCRRIDQVL